MNTTAKHFTNAVSFVAGLLLMLFLISKAVTPAEGTVDNGVDSKDANGILAEPENSIDLLFVGDSETYSSVIPLELWDKHGFTSYCLSSSAQKLYYAEELIEAALSRQRPRVVMLETNMLFTKFNFDDSLLHKAGSVLPVFKYHDRWKVLLDGFMGEETDTSEESEFKGYRLYTKVNPADAAGYMKPSDQKAAIPSRCKSYLKEIKEYCEERGAQFILFSTPSTKNASYPRHNAITALAKQLGIEYIDLNTDKSIKIDWSTDTRDRGDHLNYLGAAKATKAIGEHLAKKELLPDHRGEEAYSRWDELYKVFTKKVKKALKKAGLS